MQRPGPGEGAPSSVSAEVLVGKPAALGFRAQLPCRLLRRGPSLAFTPDRGSTHPLPALQPLSAWAWAPL